MRAPRAIIRFSGASLAVTDRAAAAFRFKAAAAWRRRAALRREKEHASLARARANRARRRRRARSVPVHEAHANRTRDICLARSLHLQARRSARSRCERAVLTFLREPIARAVSQGAPQGMAEAVRQARGAARRARAVRGHRAEA